MTPQGIPQVQRLIYREPQLGRDYWVLDDALPDALAIRERFLRREDWTLGAPHRRESWPGMRAQPALTADEIAPIEDWVRKQTGQRQLFQVKVGGDASVSHNSVQVVSASEGQSRPHTDSRVICKYAGVLYLSPAVPAYAGTTFYRMRQPDGRLAGNVLPSRYANLVEALGTRFVAPELFVPDRSVDYRFNRLLVYRADLIHSATAYFGDELSTRRMSVVFFWMAR